MIKAPIVLLGDGWTLNDNPPQVFSPIHVFSDSFAISLALASEAAVLPFSTRQLSAPRPSEGSKKSIP